MGGGTLCISYLKYFEQIYKFPSFKEMSIWNSSAAYLILAGEKREHFGTYILGSAK